MDILQRIKETDAMCLYFKGARCSVCDILQPKISNLLEDRFPKIEFMVIDPEEYPNLVGRMHVFSAPTILVFFNGKETLRKSGNMSVPGFSEEIERIYDLFFN